MQFYQFPSKLFTIYEDPKKRRQFTITDIETSPKKRRQFTITDIETFPKKRRQFTITDIGTSPKKLMYNRSAACKLNYYLFNRFSI